MTFMRWLSLVKVRISKRWLSIGVRPRGYVLEKSTAGAPTYEKSWWQYWIPEKENSRQPYRNHGCPAQSDLALCCLCHFRQCFFELKKLLRIQIGRAHV